MKRLFFAPFYLCCSIFLTIVVSCSVAAGQSQPTSRVVGRIDDRVRVSLRGNVHPLARSANDQGAVPDSFPAERMLVLLQRAPERETALREFLQDVHRPGNPRYHHWLKPEQFGAVYGPTDAEINAVRGWLQAQGFSIGRVSRGKNAIEFSGTAGQVRNAFRTEIHTYLVNGAEHHANNADPQIPAALSPVIAGITPMNDFSPQPYIRNAGEAVYDPRTHKLVPNWTFPSGVNLLELAPADFALQYDLNPLYNAGVNGKGVTIGIIGASNVDPAVVATYRSFFGLPPGTLNVVIDGSDPGLNYAAGESFLDVEEAGAVAPGATINLYTAADTSLQYGLSLAALRAVDDDVATVLSTSYGNCEQNFGAAGNLFWASLWEQAAAQGQTSFVSAGDGGPAGCDNFNSFQAAQYGVAVNAIASTPWNVAVGGTDFYYTSYGADAATQQTEIDSYWDTVPTLYPTTSLLKPVPEQPWNDPFGLNLNSKGIYNSGAPNIVAGSGGPSSCATGVESSNGAYSSCTAGYPKPSWQTGAGVPADGARDLPDVSLFAAAGENDTLYPVCFVSWECVVQDGNLTIGIVGGTSASSPAMAGILALVNQKYGPQGQANYTLYPLAAQHPSVFHDVTNGSNVVPCLAGSLDCVLSTANDNTKGYYTLGFDAGPGYDMATGLGSVDANLLVQNWNSLTFKSTSTTLTLNQTSFPHGTPVSVSVGVSGSGGTPSGDVALVTTPSPSSSTGVGDLTLQAGAASAIISSLPGGQYQVKARYGGDNLFASSTSAPVTVNVTPEASNLSLSAKYYDWQTNSYKTVANGSSYPYGTYFLVDAQPQGVKAAPGAFDGIPTGTVAFTDAGVSGATVSESVDHAGTAEWFPSTGFAVGNHSLSASYSGDVSFGASSTAAPLTFSMTKIAPGMDVYVGNVIGFNQNATFGVGVPVPLTAIVGFTAPALPPSGTVTFYSGSTVLGTASLGPPPFYNPSVSAATLNVTNLPLGTNTITASYAGDSNFNSATSQSSVTIVIMQQATITATVNPPSGTLAQSYTVTANVAGANGQPAPTGAVTFYVVGGSSWIGGGNLVNGSVSFSFDGSPFFPGTVSVQATYTGDTVYAPSAVTIPVSMTVPFTMSATPVTIASSGATTGNTSTITVTPSSGFTGSVFFSCTIEYYPPGAQQLPTCSVPTSVNITGTSAVTATMTISSTPSTTVAGLPSSRGARWLAPQFGFGIAAFVLLGIPSRRRRAARLAALLIVLAIITGLPACGGGSSGGGGGGKPVPGTTTGTYKFMVEGSFTSNIGSSFPQVSIVDVTIQ